MWHGPISRDEHDSENGYQSHSKSKERKQNNQLLHKINEQKLLTIAYGNIYEQQWCYYLSTGYCYVIRNIQNTFLIKYTKLY